MARLRAWRLCLVVLATALVGWIGWAPIETVALDQPSLQPAAGEPTFIEANVTTAVTSQEARRSRVKAEAQLYPQFGPRAAAPIASPFPRTEPTDVPSGEQAVHACSDEARRRIHMCVGIVGAFMRPNTRNEIGLMHTKALERIEKACTSPRVPSTVDQRTCEQMKLHLLGATDLRTLQQAMRNEDVHNICVKLLGMAVGGEERRWLSESDAKQCHMSHKPGRQNEGITGVRCLFFHGSGVSRLAYDQFQTAPGDYDGFLPTYPAYWGGIEKSLDGRCDARFYVTDTTTRGWENVSLQREYCAAIRQFQPHAIFAHSSANAVLAAGIANKIRGCDYISAAQIGPSGEGVQAMVAGESLWYAVNPLWMGTPLIDTLKTSCAAIDGPTPVWYDGVCQRQYARPYPGFVSLDPTFVNRVAVSLTADEKYGRAQFACDASGLLNHFEPDEPIRKKCRTLRDVATRHVSGGMCGVTPERFTHAIKRAVVRSKENFVHDPSLTIEWGGQDALTAASKDAVSGHDGFVPFSSCKVPTRQYGLTPAAAFYATTTNHDDGRCAHGEGAASLQQPCSWYAQRVGETKQRFGALQQFRSRKEVKSAPRTTFLAPDYNKYKYDADATMNAVKEQIAAFASTFVQPQYVAEPNLPAIVAPTLKATTKAASPPVSAATRENMAALKDAEAKLTQSIANLKQYEQALA